jgi:hypothetical protein
MSQSEPRNPFYLLLLLASLLFVVTALAYVFIPLLEEKAIIQAGTPPPPSPLRDALRQNGWLWLLYEVGAMVLFGLLSMGLDRLRSLQKERAERTIPPSDANP